MHIQEIIVDGFKSYAQRTVIEGFDPHFNAITGLNGSGKSNILDSICFVLGITNLSQVRAGNLSELVYKQGQAGVNKATVTIVFNNSDPSTSPLGYEQVDQVTVTRQVLLGGKSKYLINGRNAPAGQVQNLFHSVQLNVNNPHFLIMQGRITKVLNMKPNEILGMVEEAAGTRMYETKRVAALKTMEKKQLKLNELQTILEEEITPTLERLRGEKQSYLTWSKNNADVERLERFVTAAEYTKAVAACESDGMSELESQISSLENRSKEVKSMMEAKDAEINERSRMLQGEFADTLRAAKELEKDRSKELVKLSSAWKSRKDTVQKAERDLDAARKLVQDSKAAIEAKRTELKDESDKISEMLEEARVAQERLAQLKEDYQNMSAGISSSQGDEGRTLPDQISKALSDSKTAHAKIEQAKLRIAHLTKEVKSVENELKKESAASTKFTKKRDEASAKVGGLKAQLDQLDFSEDEHALLEREKQELESSASYLRETVETLTAKLSAKLSFRYQDPVRGFDRSKVKGLVSKLIAVRDPKNATALEVAAAGKLYQVVVDEAITGKALLDRGKLERRVTLIPLDKIKPRQLGKKTCEDANAIAAQSNATAQPAIELVDFDEEVRSAIEYVFGATFVVDSGKAATQICDATKMRTVTLEGDMYDPSGTISGGSKDSLGSTLSNLFDLKKATQDLNEKHARLAIVSEKLRSMDAVARKFEKLSRDLAVADAELKAADTHLSQTSFGVLVEKRDAMASDLDAAQRECVEMEKEKSEKRGLYESLKAREKDLTQERENRLKLLDKAVHAAKVEAAEKAKRAGEAESRSQTFNLELECLETDVATAEDAVSTAEKVLLDETNHESDLQMKVGEAQRLYEEAKQELDELSDRVTSCSTELAGLKNEHSSLAKEAESIKLETKKLSLAAANLKKERSASEKLVASMLKQHPWIETEKNSFGVLGGDYDFEANNPSKASKRLKQLQSEQESLAKKINKKVMGMIEKAEGEYTELIRKRKVVENDKKKIQAVIEELDVKKKAELDRTWLKVNKDFGSIFTTLLPGAAAKLEPPEGMQAWEGLEVRVAFGSVWKDSLSELSGGQRSLLALSLILSLLLFKPAPMYILDEVDAALDLSHTQNIGNMLKTHFSQSQFIVVSLKEGMFNNANVIFRTKFVDGVSTVTRTIGTGSSRARALGDSNGDDSVSQAGLGKSAKGAGRRRGKENSTD